jgi:hypothetical protein
MSKAGIMIALGPPPRHANPDLERDSWIYWKSRLRQMRIAFDRDGKVVRIDD